MQTEFVFTITQQLMLDSWKSRTLLKAKRSLKNKMRNLELMLRKPFSDLKEQISNCLLGIPTVCSRIVRA